MVDAEEFLTLAPEQVAKLICSDRLMVPSEEKVFECVISWVHHDLEKRQNDLALLMEHVRLPLLSQEYLVQRVEEEPLLKANLQCKLVITTYMLKEDMYTFLNFRRQGFFNRSLKISFAEGRAKVTVQNAAYQTETTEGITQSTTRCWRPSSKGDQERRVL